MEDGNITCFKKEPVAGAAVPFDENYSEHDMRRDIKRDPKNKKVYENKFYSALDWRTDKQLGIKKAPLPKINEIVRMLPIPQDQEMPTLSIMMGTPGE